MVPLNPALHRQELTTLTPVLLAGQATGVHDPEKNGEDAEATMAPLKPALQLQPAITSVPVLLKGQGTGLHTPV